MLEKSIKINVEYKDFAGIINSIVTEAFRSMEKFLQTNCGIMVQSISKPELRILYPILLNIRKFLNTE